MSEVMHDFPVSPALVKGEFDGFMLDTHHQVIHKIHEGHSCHHVAKVSVEHRHYVEHLDEHHEHEYGKCKVCFGKHF